MAMLMPTTTQVLAASMCLSFFVLPVPKSDAAFVACLWAYAATCSLVYPPQFGNVRYSGSMPFRPVVQGPLRRLQDAYQVSSFITGLAIPFLLLLLSRSLHIKLSESLRAAVSSQLFLQLAQYSTEGLAQWPACLAPPVWLSVCQFMTVWRLHRCFDWYIAAGAMQLWPMRANRFGLRLFRWLMTHHPGRVWIVAAIRVASVTCFCGTLFEAAVMGPMELSAFIHPKYAGGSTPTLHAYWEQTHGTSGAEKEE
jgi:hypothetical protein